MAELIDLRHADDPRDALHRAVEQLAAGRVVVLPTETTYAAAVSSTHPDDVARLRERTDGPLAVLFRSVDEALDYVPKVDPVGERLMRRLWPGSVVIEVPTEQIGGAGLAGAWDERVRAAVLADGHLRLTVCGYDVIDAVQRLLPAPLVLLLGHPESSARTAAEAADRCGGEASLLIEDGPPPIGEGCTILRLTDSQLTAEGWDLVRPGRYDATAVRERTAFGIVFVCTGNTCRSPLAEAMFRKLLAQRLGCEERDLLKRGVRVASAGLSAGQGLPAAAESLVLAQEHGFTLDRHRSRPLTDELLDGADYVYAMTEGHRSAILAARPDLVDRVHLVSREGLDIADPIGRGPAEYERCRAEIERELLAILEHLPLPPTATFPSKSLRDEG